MSTDANQAYDITVPIHLDWHADRPGSNPGFWRSPTNVDYNLAESWYLQGSGTQRVTLPENPFQPGLTNAAFRFDPNDAIKRTFFHVGDSGNSFIGNVAPASLIDHDRSATFDFWVRFDSLTAEQVLFEAGHSTEGLSITIGDADVDGKFNDLRLRVLGDDGQFINTTVQLDKYVDPKADYIHIAAVMNDSTTDRYAALYVNGALLGRVNGVLGAAGSIDWDGYLHLGDELATIGRESGNNLGGNSGLAGQRPFSGGGLSADLTQFNFRNYALSDAEVLGEYNQRLAPVGWGVIATSGSALKPGDRPSNIAQDAFETNGGITILHERLDKLSAPLAVDVVPTSGATYSVAGSPLPGGNIASGQTVASYLVHFDAAAGATHGLISGSFTFAAPVLGVMLSEASLTAADRVLGVIGQYDQADRVLTADESATIQLSVDLRTLTISLTASAADFFEFRVLTAAPNLMPGDFNGDGFVSMADYDQWKHDYGSQSYLSDANHDGRVDAADYTIWRDHLGSQLAQASAVEGSAVPEPVTSAMLVATALGWLGASRMRRTRAA